MQNALLVGLSRQVALGRQLDVVANNIANLNTTGYKADGALFEAYVVAQCARRRPVAQDSQVNFVRDRATWVEWSQGAMERTGNPLDVAIEGKGFLVVDAANGERYTRNGALQDRRQRPTGDRRGRSGARRQRPDRLPAAPTAASPSARTAPSACARPAALTKSTRGQLRLVSFANNSAAAKRRHQLFRRRQRACSRIRTSNRAIVQGAVEKSNISAVLEMTHMIEVTRSYQQIGGNARATERPAMQRRSTSSPPCRTEPGAAGDRSCAHSTLPRPE